MKLHMPHPRRAAEQRQRERREQAARIKRAVRQSRLADRAPQAWDWESELRRQQRGRSR